MTSVESTDSNVVEVDGIRFETLVPEPVFTVPVKQPECDDKLFIPVRVGIRITNNTPNPFRFSSYRRLTPELVGADGQALQGVYLRRRRLAPKESDFPLVISGDSVTFFPDAKLVVYKAQPLRLSIAAGDGGYRSFQLLNPGIYRFRFLYKNEEEVEALVNGKSLEITDTKLLTGFWTGVVFTPFVECRLVRVLN